MAENKQPETLLPLRYAEAELLLSALKLLPKELCVSVTYQGLNRQLTIIKDHWLKMERDRKAQQVAVIRRKIKKP